MHGIERRVYTAFPIPYTTADLRVNWRLHLGHRIGIGDIKDTGVITSVLFDLQWSIGGVAKMQSICHYEILFKTMAPVLVHLHCEATRA